MHMQIIFFVSQNDPFSYLKQMKQTHFLYLKTVRFSYLKIALLLYLKTAQFLYLEAIISLFLRMIHSRISKVVIFRIWKWWHTFVFEINTFSYLKITHFINSINHCATMRATRVQFLVEVISTDLLISSRC